MNVAVGRMLHRYKLLKQSCSSIGWVKRQYMFIVCIVETFIHVFLSQNILGSITKCAFCEFSVQIITCINSSFCLVVTALIWSDMGVIICHSFQFEFY